MFEDLSPSWTNKANFDTVLSSHQLSICQTMQYWGIDDFNEKIALSGKHLHFGTWFSPYILFYADITKCIKTGKTNFPDLTEPGFEISMV